MALLMCQNGTSDVPKNGTSEGPKKEHMFQSAKAPSSSSGGNSSGSKEGTKRRAAPRATRGGPSGGDPRRDGANRRPETEPNPAESCPAHPYPIGAGAAFGVAVRSVRVSRPCGGGAQSARAGLFGAGAAFGCACNSDTIGRGTAPPCQPIRNVSARSLRHGRGDLLRWS